MKAPAMFDLLSDEDEARTFLEFCRWGSDCVCPHCGGRGRLGRLPGNGHRHGLFKCYACRKFFNVRTGTLLEGSHLQSATILAAVYLMIATDGMIGPTTLANHLGVTPQTAIKLSRKVRGALRQAKLLEVSGAGSAEAKFRLKELLSTADSVPNDGTEMLRRERERRLRDLATLVWSKKVEQLFPTAVRVLLLPQPGAANSAAALARYVARPMSQRTVEP